MIIIMRVSSVNEKAAKKLAAEENCSYIYYAQPVTHQADNTNITLLDLTEAVSNTRPSVPSIADYLNKNNLIKEGTLIKILFHDIDNTLPQFISRLNEYIEVNFQKKVNILSLTNTDYEYTIITHSENKWKVYGIHKKDIPLENTTTLLSQLNQKVLLWEGNRMDNNHAFSSKTELHPHATKSPLNKP